MPTAIHITGASGTGTSTLGRALAERFGAMHLDTDDFYWEPVEPRYTIKRPPEVRVAMIEAAMAAAAERGWVLSGSISEWGTPLVSRFALVVFLTAPTPVRLSRLRAREVQRFGPEALQPGGTRHRLHEDFIEWASAYDDADSVGRNRARHETWLAALPCPVLRLDGTGPVEDLVVRVADVL